MRKFLVSVGSSQLNCSSVPSVVSNNTQRGRVRNFIFNSFPKKIRSTSAIHFLYVSLIQCSQKRIEQKVVIHIFTYRLFASHSRHIHLRWQSVRIYFLTLNNLQRTDPLMPRLNSECLTVTRTNNKQTWAWIKHLNSFHPNQWDDHIPWMDLIPSPSWMQ